MLSEADEEDAGRRSGHPHLAARFTRQHHGQGNIQHELSRLSSDDLDSLRSYLSQTSHNVGRIFENSRASLPQPPSQGSYYGRSPVMVNPPVPSFDTTPLHPRLPIPAIVPGVPVALICGCVISDPDPNTSLFEITPCPLPSPRRTERSTPATKPPPKLNGCGTLVHSSAHRSEQSSLYVAKGAATEAVIPLPAEYFDMPEAMEGHVPCGCSWYGVGCKNCGAPLGEEINPCAQHGKQNESSLFTFDGRYVTPIPTAAPGGDPKMNGENNLWTSLYSPMAQSRSITAPAERAQPRSSPSSSANSLGEARTQHEDTNRRIHTGHYQYPRSSALPQIQTQTALQSSPSSPRIMVRMARPGPETSWSNPTSAVIMSNSAVRAVPMSQSLAPTAPPRPTSPPSCPGSPTPIPSQHTVETNVPIRVLRRQMDGSYDEDRHMSSHAEAIARSQRGHPRN